MSRENERWLRYQGRGKSKADQHRFIAATKWASEVGPELEAMARKLIKDLDEYRRLRTIRVERQPDEEWKAVAVEVEDESSEEYKTHFILNPEVTREDVQRRLRELKQNQPTNRLHRIEQSRNNVLAEQRAQQSWVIQRLRPLDKKYEELFVLSKSSPRYGNEGIYLDLDANARRVWQAHQPTASKHQFALDYWGGWRQRRKLDAIKDQANTIINQVCTPVGYREHWLGSRRFPVTQEEAVAEVKSLLKAGKKVLPPYTPSFEATLLNKIKEELNEH